MALTLAIAAGSPGGPIVVNQTMNFTVTVTNTGSAAVALQSLSIGESTESDCVISQPNIMTAGAPASSGFPVLAASGSASFPFQVIFTSPAQPGSSPNAPGGSLPDQRAETADAQFTLQAQAQSSDGSVASVSQMVSVLTAIAPFPVPQGGATQFGQGANTNLIAAFA